MPNPDSARQPPAAVTRGFAVSLVLALGAAGVGGWLGPTGLVWVATLSSVIGCGLLGAAKWHLLRQRRWAAFLWGLGPRGYPPAATRLWWRSLPWWSGAMLLWVWLLILVRPTSGA